MTVHGNDDGWVLLCGGELAVGCSVAVRVRGAACKRDVGDTCLRWPTSFDNGAADIRTPLSFGPMRAGVEEDANLSKTFLLYQRGCEMASKPLRPA